MSPRRYEHSGVFAFEAQDKPKPRVRKQEPAETPAATEDAEFIMPQDPDELAAHLADLPAEDLDETNEDSLLARALAAFDELHDKNPSDETAVADLLDLRDYIVAVRGEKARREAAAAEAQAKAKEAYDSIHGATPDAEPDDGDEGEPEGAQEKAPKVETPPPAPVKAEAPVAEPLAASGGVEVKRAAKRLNVSLSDRRKYAPSVEARPRLNITAAADVPRYAAGSPLADMFELADAYRERAASTPVANSGTVIGPKVATIRREYEHTVTRDTSDAEMAAMIKEMTSQQRLEDALVAGGGWCSPSATVYDFFEIVCEDGLLDLPTFGVDRGGIRFPTSPSYADFFTGTFNNTTNPWLWSETDDILTVTGSTNKPCVRVPCPTFNDRRLECYGICVVAGNLTDSAYPEATVNTLNLLRSAHAHAMNQRIIATIAAMSTVVATGGLSAGEAISIDLPAVIGWAAVDYRTRFGMCRDDILEVVLPIWALEVMRADMAARTGVDLGSVSDAQIGEYFDVRRVRVQYVNDWQIRGTNQPGGSSPTVLYPAQVQFMIFAAGTFGLGNGLMLDLGVVRDSVLNAENDFTAAWSEECHLVAQFGHLARTYAVNICAAGRTGSANLTACGTS